MATIRLKRSTGSSAPSSGLTFGEPAFTDGINSLYVWKNNNTAVRVGAEVSTDTTLASNSDNKIASEKAIKTYVDNAVTVAQGGAVTSISGVTGAVVLGAGTGISIAAGTHPNKGITITNIGVQQIAGTSNQVLVNSGTSGVTGSVTISLPSAITTPGSLTTTTDLTVGGNLTVNGTTTTVNSTTLTVEDSLVFLAKGNSAADSLDIGIYGMYDSGGNDLYAGFFRDSSDSGKFKLFSGLTAAPTNVVDTVATSFTKGTLSANIEGTVNGLSVSTSTGTLTIANGKTLTASNTLTFTGTDSSSVAFGGGGTVVYTSNNLSAFASTTSAQLATVISDETGTGPLVFSNGPTLVNPILGTPQSGTLTNCTGYPVANIANLGSGVATFLTTPTSANLISAVSDETGSGSLVFATSPTLVTPILGTPQSGTLTNCTGYPVANIANLGTGVATFLTTPTSANLISAVTDETGSGSLVFATSPTLVTPTLGVASATSINKVAITAPATSATLTIADGKTLTASNTLTFTGTDSSSVAFGAGGTVVYTSNKLSVHASTTSAELAGVISDETGSGALVFANTPTLVTPVLGVATATSINGFAIQNAAADSTTKGLAAFTTGEFTASSGVISIGTVDGGSY